jgi:phage terminase large subunit GpA-like protein
MAKTRRRSRKQKQKIKATSELSTADKLLLLRKAFYEAIAFDESMDLDDWSDKYRILPQETSSEHGAWITARFPFLRKIMKKLSPSSLARMIVVMKGAQLGFTESAINWILYNAHCRPGPLLYTQKTDDAARDFSNQKLKPSILVCEALAGILGDQRPKQYASSWDNKAYPGGFAVLGGANSTPFLRSKSIRDAIADEEDTFERSLGNEGSPIWLIIKRMVNFPDKKFYRLSTPLIKETSTIEPAYEAGSQEQYYVPCPHCNPNADEDGHMFVIKWENIKYSKELDNNTGNPKDVWCECPHCASRIDEALWKTWMLDNGDWYSVKGAEKRYKVGDVPNPSFQISSLYSPFGFFSWDEAVGEWFEYQRTKDVALLQVFINQTLAETFSLEGSEISHEYLYNRRESYSGNLGDFDVPMDALCLTAGVDIQDDRIEVETVGWGLLEENWSIDYTVLPGDTALKGDRYGMLKTGQPSVWRLLDDYLMRQWKHESGVHMPIEVTMIDAKYKTEEVHTFCRLRESRRIFPVTGKEGWGRGLFEAKRRRHARYGTMCYQANVDELKNKVYAQLQIDQPGPGFCHFPKNAKYTEKYFKGLTCEKRSVRMVNGSKVLFWECPEGARNEPIDLRDYAYTAFLAYPVNLPARARQGLVSLFGQVQKTRKRRRRRGHPGL